MPLRSIPPITACKRAPRQQPRRLLRSDAPPEATAWKPTVHTRLKQPPGLLTRHHVEAEVAKNIARLTNEIDNWLEEFGEQALLALYEERSRWAEGLR
jgi:hypothetical protein